MSTNTGSPQKCAHQLKHPSTWFKPCRYCHLQQGLADRASSGGEHWDEARILSWIPPKEGEDKKAEEGGGSGSSNKTEGMGKS